MKCSGCGGSLSPKSDICRYCGALNDTDLRALHFYTKNTPESDRVCPRCAVKMQTIDLELDGKFYVERCERCLGIFFDPGELDYAIDASVSNVFEVDHKKLDVLIDERHKKEHRIVYVKCPICEKLMNRKSYGARSGVIVDICRDHGVWVDGGELGTLLRWSKAGGQLHSKAKAGERERIAARKADPDKSVSDMVKASLSEGEQDDELLSQLLSLITTDA